MAATLRPSGWSTQCYLKHCWKMNEVIFATNFCYACISTEAHRVRLECSNQSTSTGPLPPEGYGSHGRTKTPSGLLEPRAHHEQKNASPAIAKQTGPIALQYVANTSAIGGHNKFHRRTHYTTTGCALSNILMSMASCFSPSLFSFFSMPKLSSSCAAA